MHGLKRIWKNLPPQAQSRILKTCCSLLATRRDGHTHGDDPVYVVGSLRSATGIGEGARLYLQSARDAGRQACGVDATSAMLQQAVLPPEGIADCLELSDLATHIGGGTVVIHANPPLFHMVLLRMNRKFLRNKRLVAYWAWELECLPQIYLDALDHVDAVEVPSEFTANAFRRVTDKEVRVVPHKLPEPVLRKAGFCADGVMRCLYVFDMASSCERKNPWAAIAAFAAAFPNGRGASLTLKTSQHQAAPHTYRRLLALADATPGVTLMTENLTAGGLDELYLHHDVYLSTHRSEGYGLTIHEAMLRGLHVAATGWSANMEFMKGPLAHPLPFTLVPVPAGQMPACGKAVRWAEVDTQGAAEVLKALQKTLCTK
ncbi:glycosyltransferase [Nitratidesulfovibrio sp. SRB-5]|uniref:glycosyltransferase n=1 Tax=Nitratidesulfovibrio sp. SRB-5 TaxID=2872636 RepID=UPI0010256E63|nr:glycosyltransferase [Nitratidesulfovibrio sp. SRB-5]MBZ2170888.1 glycosyltransferase [Nitratidesulfovibrio sp. SRB-5]RXF78115.1 glycosyltransferase family 1 protein [Desulfovibrio sp. DS-1]